jgi:O-antigen ligase
MAFALTLLYLLTFYVTPGDLFGDLAQYRVELVIAFLALLASIPSLSSARVLASRQTLALIGFSFAIGMSIVVSGWLGGTVIALYTFAPVLFCFFLVAINCRTKLHLQLVVLTLFLGSAYYVFQGAWALHGNIDPSPYVMNQGDELRRIRGLGVVNDPNDLSQLFVALMPCLFFSWKSRSPFNNVLFVWLPTTILIAGMYLCHSRGAAIAIAVVLISASRRKIGLVPAVLVAGGLLVAGLALGWSGGREVSADAGADRTDAWYVGLQLIKSHPVFGVGFGHFTDYYPITAHNSVVVCAAEVGLVGLFFWILIVFSMLREGVLLGREETVADSANSIAGSRVPASLRLSGIEIAQGSIVAPYEMRVLLPTSPAAPNHVQMVPQYVGLGVQTNDLDDSEIRRMARLLVISITGFLVAGWFLSRAFSAWLFVLLGMMFVVVRMAEDKKIVTERATLRQDLQWAAAVAAISLVVVSASIRIGNLLSR